MLEDRILIKKARLGDQQAFDRIYTKYLDMLLTVAQNLLGNPQEAEDVVQDVFVKLIESYQLDDQNHTQSHQHDQRASTSHRSP